MSSISRGSFYSRGAKWKRCAVALFKGFVYQADFHEFLVSPQDTHSRRAGFERGLRAVDL